MLLHATDEDHGFCSHREQLLPLQQHCDNQPSFQMSSDDAPSKPSRMTFDFAELPAEDVYEKFKECILKERVTNNKAYQLQLKEQDDMIKQLRTKVIENRQERSMISGSRCTVNESCISLCLEQVDGEAVERKRCKLERSITHAPAKLQRMSSRTQILRSTKTVYYQNGDLSKAKDVLLSPQEQLLVAQLPERITLSVFSC